MFQDGSIETILPASLAPLPHRRMTNTPRCTACCGHTKRSQLTDTAAIVAGTFFPQSIPRRELAGYNRAQHGEPIVTPPSCQTPPARPTHADLWALRSTDWIAPVPCNIRDPHSGSKRFPFNDFKHYLTLFSKFFSSFPHGTCSLSVSCPYLALDGTYHPLRAAIPSNSTRRTSTVRQRAPRHRRDCHPL